MKAHAEWTRGLTIGGGVATVAGGLDPLEGSPLLLLGSVLLALAGVLGEEAPRVRMLRFCIVVMIGVGVAAVWGLSALGGVGGDTGRSLGWMALTVPMVVGWSVSFWGWGAPRWLTWAGIVAGAWYAAIPVLVLARAGDGRLVSVSLLVPLALAGLATALACGWRLFRPDQSDLRR